MADRVHELAVSGISTTFLTVTAGGAAAELFGSLACLPSTCGFLPTAAAEGLERLTTAKPKIDLSFNGSGFLMTAFSEVSLRLGCAPRESTAWAVDKAGITSLLSAVFASSRLSDLEALGVSFHKRIENFVWRQVSKLSNTFDKLTIQLLVRLKSHFPILNLILQTDSFLPFCPFRFSSSIDPATIRCFRDFEISSGTSPVSLHLLHLCGGVG
jgi:hypothetical protein